MKKYLIIPFILLLIAGCTFAPSASIDTNNALEAGTSSMNVLGLTSVTPASGSALTDNDPNENDIQEIIYIVFDRFLTDAVVTETGFELTEENNAASISDFTIEYQKEFNRVKIAATFDDDGAYMLRLQADDIVSENGDFLDGNGNGINDGSPYDDIMLTYYTGTGWQDFKDYTHPYLWDFGPTWGNVSTNGQFWVDFDEPMDSASVVENIGLYDDSGDRMNNDTLVWMSWDKETYQFMMDDIDDMSMFYVTLTCAEITDSAGNVMIPYNMEYITDTPEDFTYYFMTRDDDPTEDDVPLHVTGVAVNNDYLEIFFDDTLDVTTLTNDNILVYYLGGASEDYYIPGEIILSDDAQGVLYSLTNYDNSLGYTLKVVVKTGVKDDAGFMLDNNWSYIGGEVYDPFRKYYTSGDDYVGYY